MPVIKKLATTASIAVLGLFAIYVVSTPFLREPPTPVVNVTIVPQPLNGDHSLDGDHEGTGNEAGEMTTDETTSPEPLTTSGAYRTGERTGETLNRLWQETKAFGRGFWSTITEKEQ